MKAEIEIHTTRAQGAPLYRAVQDGKQVGDGYLTYFEASERCEALNKPVYLGHARVILTTLEGDIETIECHESTTDKPRAYLKQAHKAFDLAMISDYVSSVTMIMRNLTDGHYEVVQREVLA